jgi:hypothetical protein
MAISGGKDRLAAASRTIAQPFESIVQKPLDPLPHVLLRQVDEAGDLDQRNPVGDLQDRTIPPGQA